ncbi:23065_t:CDS:2 [Cetraspora pellucida]|uniref:23065_t:CDS:1 n=1 Tax=Cetraspora pellucida TaxID=1433469 RepID=A0A9N9CI23_9GLOM|nr:23065_t:CDS:2 [Cetraspora pellucida]
MCDKFILKKLIPDFVNSILISVTSSLVTSMTCLNNNAFAKSYMLFSNLSESSKNLFLHLSHIYKKNNSG